MGTQLFSNNATTVVNGSIANGDTQINVSTATGTLFPNPSGGDYFVFTLYEKNGAGQEINYETIKCTQVVGDALKNCTRDFEGIVGVTGGRAYPSSVAYNPSGVVYCALRLTASGANNFLKKDDNLLSVGSASTARTNLGLGSMATQAAGSVAITGGTLAGVAISTVTLTSPTMTSPALGTPASGILTNCTGTASGLTAGNTSAISGGAANQIVYQTGSGATGFVATGASGVLVTNSSSVPSISSALPASLSIPDARLNTASAVSAAGTNQAGATAITTDVTIVTTVAANAGVVIPTAAVGKVMIIYNKGANPLAVYPNSTNTIDSLGASIAYSVPVNGRLELIGFSATQWYSDIPTGSGSLLTFATGLLSLAGNLTTSGAYPTTLTTTATTGLTLPTTGTLATLAGAESLSNKTIAFSGAATITAGTNAQGQGVITTDINLITTAANAPSGVTLPTPALGKRCFVINRGANIVNVYPPTSCYIDSQTINTSMAVPVGGTIEFIGTSSTQWYSEASSQGLQSATTVVNTSTATAPINGQVLTATSSTTATWQTPSTGIGKVIAMAMVFGK